ncbi:MAG: BTAD domain-containing putative transcriptional regulator [Chloroflexota bacterium]|nr:BTAD domain-containing putative transcriptional regulator [Chloroflexota bacterium]
MVGEKEQETLILRLLGEPQFLYQGATLTKLLARKEQALLIYLACQPEQRFSRDHLATLLWGETIQSQARYNLRRALWHLRRVLTQAGLPSEACLAVEGPWICIHPTAPCWVDVLDFEQVLQACFQDLQSRFSPASEGSRRIHKALDLYQGNFVSGFSVPRAPNLEEWITFERERLFMLLLRALTSLIQGFIARGEQSEAVAACQRLLVLDPLQEDIHRLLMRLYWETGQRVQALRQYRTYRDLLQRELDIEPLEETQGLYRRILQDETPPTSTSSLVLTSRLTPPSPAPESLPRPRLFSLLDRGLTVRLTLLSAPPGYGKTTLLAQWLAARPQSRAPQQPRRSPLFAWYKVSETDNEPLTFIEGLAASVTQLHPAVRQAMQGGIHDFITPQRNLRQAVGLLVNALASLEPVSFAIVLDDLESLTSSDSHQVLQYLLEHLPANGHLYLLTRVDPPLPLPRLRVRGQLLEIRAAELRFTDEEMTTFLRQAPGPNLSPAEVAELTTRAEGWIAPLWLAANALSRFTVSLDDVWEGLFAYLREEVLASQPPELRAFLLHSAVLDRLSPGLCQDVLDFPESVDSPAEWLSVLERRNLFLRRVVPQAPHTEPQYTYHPLFLAFLRTELVHRLSDAEIGALHRRAAKAWEQQNDLEQALFHCQQAGDEQGIARLLEQIAPAYLQQGRLEPLAHWLDQLGPAVRDQHPRLTLNAGQLRQAEGRVEEARLLYRRAATDFGVQQDSVAQGDSLLALAKLELLRGHYTEGIQLGQRAMACWDEADIQRRTATLCASGQLQACQGDLSDAKDSLKQAERLILGHGHPLYTFQVLRFQAWVAYLRGAYRQAMGLNRLAEQEAGPDVSPEIVATLRNPVPAILREWGESNAAWKTTHRRLEAASQIQDRLALSHAYTNLGNLYLDREQFVKAEEAFCQAIAEAEAAGENGLHRLCGEIHLVHAHFLQGHAMEAAEIAEAALRRCQTRDTSPLELALAQTAVSLAHVRDINFLESFRQLVEVYRTFARLGVRYGVFVSGTLISLVCLQADRERQARRYLADALALAAAEGYVQTIVTSRRVLLPLMLFALREGLEPRFVSQTLAPMGLEPLQGVVEMTQATAPRVRERAAAALKVIGAQEETWEAAFAALERLAHDPDPGVRAVAAQARRSLRPFFR